MHHVPDEEVDDYNRILADARNNYSSPPAPAMPIISSALSAKAATEPARGDPSTDHQENVALAGFVTDSWFATVHTPISIEEALKIPAAREDLDAEWEKLEKR